MRALKLSRAEQQVGGVRFEGDSHTMWQANRWLRTAIRVLDRLARFPAPDADALYRGVRRIDWRPFLRPDGSLRVDAQCRESALDHSRFVEQRVKDAVVDAFRKHYGRRPRVDTENPDLRIHAHLWRDRCTLSVDTSGDSLHKRGWRRFQGRAPLNECLAAAVVLASRWDRRSPLLDPFCGSATLLIEAAWLALGRPPGGLRRFGYEKWPCHPVEEYRHWLQAEPEPRWRRLPRILGWELDPDAVQGARDNLVGAGVEELVEVGCADAFEQPAKPGWNAWIVTNPPYGVRLGAEQEALDLHRRFGDWLRQQAAGYHLGLLAGSRRASHALGLPQWDALPLRNGALRCELVSAEL